MVKYRTYRRSAAAALALVATLSVAACTAKKTTPGPASTSAVSAAAASSTPTVDPNVAAATAAYNGYLQAYAAASQAANPDDPNLARYVGGGLLLTTRHNIRQIQSLGAVQVGAQTATITGTTADLSATPPTVTIQACLDYSQLRLVYKDNRSPVPGSAVTVPRFQETATVTRFADGQWLVSDDKAHRESSC